MDINPFSVTLGKVEMIQTAIAVVFIVATIAAVIYSIWWGLLLITSGWNEEKVKPAVNHIRHSFLGLLVLLIVLFVTPKVLSLAGLPYADDLRPVMIFGKMKELSNKIGSPSSGIDDPFSTSSWDLDSLPSDFSDL